MDGGSAGTGTGRRCRLEECLVVKSSEFGVTVYILVDHQHLAISNWT
jgi:hypothetical protein